MSRHSPKEIERIKRVAAKMTIAIPAGRSFTAPSGSAAAWRALAIRLADESTAVLDNAHWEVKYGSGDLLTTIKAVREKYRLETQMPPNNQAHAGGLRP